MDELHGRDPARVRAGRSAARGARGSWSVLLGALSCAGAVPGGPPGEGRDAQGIAPPRGPGFPAPSSTDAELAHDGDASGAAPPASAPAEALPMQERAPAPAGSAPVADAAPVAGDALTSRGSPGSDAATVPAPTLGWPGPAASLGVGYFHICLTEAPSRQVKCYEGRGQPPLDVRALQVTASHHHTCVLLAAEHPDRVRCFGGYEGVGERVAWPPPGVKLSDPVQLAQGDRYLCVLERDGRVTCFGGDVPGGHLDPVVQRALRAPAGLRAKSIAAGVAMACAIQLDDSIACWGVNVAVPPVGLRARQVVVGGEIPSAGVDYPSLSRHGCALTLDQQVVCWGDNQAGELNVPAGLRATMVAAGDRLSCALLPDGAIRCWGSPPGAYREVPQPRDLRARAVFLGDRFMACAIRAADDVAVCWGRDRGTRAATGTKVFVPSPSP